MAMEVCGSAEGLVWGEWDETDDLFSKKASSTTAVFQSIIGDPQQHISRMKASFHQLSSNYFLCKGKWSVSTDVDRDHEGNRKASADINIQKETESNLRFSIQAGAEVRKDKDQKVSSGIHGSAKVEGDF